MPIPLLNIRPGAAGVTYRVFISSPNDARPARERLRDLIDDVFNPLLAESEAGIQFVADMWERTAAQRVHGRSVNQIFVERAKKSHMTMVLFVDEKGPGTIEELEAVLSEKDIALSVLRFTEASENEAEQNELGEYLAKVRTNFYYTLRTGGPRSDEAWMSLTRQLLALLLSVIYDEPRTVYTEERGKQ